jgi:hypothetical protein
LNVQTTGLAVQLADAAKLRASGRLAAALQRLAFATFAGASHFALAGGSLAFEAVAGAARAASGAKS